MTNNWCWTACWHRQAPAPLPPFDYSSIEFYGVTYDPNESELDPSNFGMMLASSPDSSGMGMTSGGGDMSLAFEYAGISSPDPELTIRQLEETIDFLYNVADEVPEEADNIAEMIESLYEEIDLMSSMEPFYESTQ